MPIETYKSLIFRGWWPIWIHGLQWPSNSNYTLHCHWSAFKTTTGHSQRPFANSPNVGGSISQVTGHRSRVTGHGSRVTGHGSRVTGHGSRVTGHGSRVTGHGSRVTGRGSRVAGRGSQVAGHRSRFTGLGLFTLYTRKCLLYIPLAK
jgi:hypothetical protein